VLVDAYRDPSPQNFKRLVQIMVYDSAFATEELMVQRSEAALAQPEHLANWLKAPMGNPGGPYGGIEDLLAKLSKSKVPTLMIHGRDDRTVPMEVTLRTAALIPDVRAVILNRCGHWTQVEHAAEFNRLVLNFLEARDTAPAQKTGFGG
jgi:2-hydroxy-6-oxonona-2,4-dienedioate hydrolase